MATTFTDLQTNISNNVQDTSNEMKVLIGVYINNRYKDILRRINWEANNFSYTITTSASTALYTLPSNFKKELYVYNATSGNELTRLTLQQYAKDYRPNDTVNDVPKHYIILDQVTGSNNERYKLIKFVKTPASAYSIEVPHTYAPSTLSGSMYPVIDCEEALEYGATMDAQRFKRQYAKAKDWEKQYELAINNLIWDLGNQPNQLNQCLVEPYSRDTV